MEGNEEKLVFSEEYTPSIKEVAPHSNKGREQQPW
jgi:hypothetical protein